MRIHYSSRFRTQYRKLTKKVRLKAQDRVRIFLQNEFDPLLGNHPLQGKYAGYRSIDITGDFRLIYERYQDNSLNFVAIGSHAELFGK